MIKFAQSALSWGISWLYFVCWICLFGAMAGVLTHSAYALFFVSSADWAHCISLGFLNGLKFFISSTDWGYYASFGFLNGLKYGSVWAGGAGIVLCVMRARKQYLARECAAAEPEVSS